MDEAAKRVIDGLHSEVYSNVKEFVVKFTGQETEKNVYKKESLIKNFKDFSIVYEGSAGVISSLPNAAMSGGMNSQNPFETSKIQQYKFLSKLSKEIFQDLKENDEEERKNKYIKIKNKK
jgi:hypothetical protein